MKGSKREEQMTSFPFLLKEKYFVNPENETFIFPSSSFRFHFVNNRDKILFSTFPAHGSAKADIVTKNISI